MYKLVQFYELLHHWNFLVITKIWLNIDPTFRSTIWNHIYSFVKVILFLNSRNNPNLYSSNFLHTESDLLLSNSKYRGQINGNRIHEMFGHLEALLIHAARTRVNTASLIESYSTSLKCLALFQLKGIEETFLNQKIWPLLNPNHMTSLRSLHLFDYNTMFSDKQFPVDALAPLLFQVFAISQIVQQCFTESTVTARWQQRRMNVI